MTNTQALPMERAGPLFAARMVPMRLYEEGAGYEVVSLTTANQPATARRAAALANSAAEMERALRRVKRMAETAWRTPGAMDGALDEIAALAELALRAIDEREGA